MQQKAFTLHNRGMNRDLSISKAGESSAYENHNIRIIARDHDTLLSVTNERGNKEIPLPDIEGELVGWNVLNNHIILFTTSDSYDYIYRIDYKDNGSFVMCYGGESGHVVGKPLYKGKLGFNVFSPIESIVYHENDDIQKIYWIDGEHPLRFLNFAADEAEVDSWNDGDNTHFDSNRAVNYGITATIEKDNSGNNRANGTVQYLLTYFNKHGQETGIVWISDLIYLSPINRGGAADEFNSNRITITFNNPDKRFTNYKVYSIFRSSYNGTAVAYVVDDGSIDDTITVVDDGAHLVAEDPSRLLYLGSQALVAGTMTHKDNTLFLGDLKSTGQDFSSIEIAIKASMYDPATGLCRGKAIEFVYSDDSNPDIKNIPYSDIEGTYSYTSQMIYSSSDILTFKGNEKYRFALVFKTKSGVDTKAFWIGDQVNYKYPVIDKDNNVIRRVVAKCTIPASVIKAIKGITGTNEISTVRLMIAEATYADRSVKAQGIINPTVFNVWERYNNRLYSVPSWISRPRRSNFACTHFAPLDNAKYSSGELQCNYWETSEDPTPYYRSQNGNVLDQLEGIPQYDYVMIMYGYVHKKTVRESNNDIYQMQCIIFKAVGSQPTYTFESYDELNKILWNSTYSIPSTNITTTTSFFKGNYKQLFHDVNKFLDDNGIIDIELKIADDNDLKTWLTHDNNTVYWRVQGNSSTEFSVFSSAITTAKKWNSVASDALTTKNAYLASLYKRHLMFVDENVITLNSPEFEYEAVYVDNQHNEDGFKLRIVGVAKITGSYSDYTVYATHGKASGENLVSDSFIATVADGNLDGLTAWPLWKDYGLSKYDPTPDNNNDYPDMPVINRTSSYYTYGGDINRYWLYLWNHLGKIDGYNPPDRSDESSPSPNDYSSLKAKTFATMRFSNETIYTSSPNVYSPDSVRMFTALASQYTGIDVDSSVKYYDGSPDFSVATAGNHKYPLLFSTDRFDTDDVITANPNASAYLYINDPIQVQYSSTAHAVLALPSKTENNVLTQEILPYMSYGDVPVTSTNATISWNEDSSYAPPSTQQFQLKDFSDIHNAISFNDDDRYLFIGELYYDFDAEGAEDTRYGGITRSDIENCTFIPAGPMYLASKLIADSADNKDAVIYGNQGDTYFQRYDCLKTKPAGTETPNSVIDITSVMLESHINLDGRTDNYRGQRFLASIDTEKFGALNHVYSQNNNYFKRRILDEDDNLDTYRASITWTLDKHDAADVDEWTHITVANNLKLDGDKGWCNALRRIGNSIIAFQDRGISEILFNSRTQLSTTDGVPVEIANSGKVDGKRYITNKYGCLNKWSIIEGKSGLYFVDNINKAFCSFNGQGIDNISERLGFGVWFRSRNDIHPWNPNDYNNIVSYYDKIHSDIYLVTSKIDDQMPCLVYNETLGAFTSFFDYDTVPMMASVQDRFVSFRNNKMWLQNEGLYCTFFKNQYDFWVNYRVTPDPFGDKIWTNVDYRADFYKVLDSYGDRLPDITEEMLINGEFYDRIPGTYQDIKTFDSLRIWNEYQNTGDISLGKNYSTDKTTRRKFRIWHVAIPRSQKSDRNKWGLDRIRNPWIHLMFKKRSDVINTDLVQLHDITVRYFE